MFTKIKYKLAKFICKVLPPILSQKIRASLIDLKDGEIFKEEFKVRSFTGSYFFGNTADFHAFKFSVHGYFDWRNIIIANEVLKEFKGNIIEVGANIGTETISFSDVAKKCNKKVYAFEPVPANYELVMKNKTKNELTNLEVYPFLVSEVKGKASFKVPTKNDSGSGYIVESQQEGNIQEFEVVTLDEIMNGIDVSFISIDVEGFEHQVIKGSSSLIQNFKPIMVVEVNKNYLEKRGNISVLNFYNKLEELGYACYYISKLGIEKVNINNFEVRPNKNWVCVPFDKIKMADKINNSIAINALNPFFHRIHF